MILHLAWMSRVECIDPQMVANFSSWTWSAELDTRYHVKLETPHVCASSLFTCRFLRGPLEEGNDIASFVHPDHHSLYNCPVSSFSCSLFLSQSRFSKASSSHFVTSERALYGGGVTTSGPLGTRQCLCRSQVGAVSNACLLAPPSQ